MTVDLPDISRRGDEDFGSLTESEKDLYCLMLFQVIHEMEGFDHFFVTDRNVHLPRILALLKAAEAPNYPSIKEMCDWIEHECPTWEPRLVEELVFRCEHDAMIDAWGDSLYSQIDPMWDAVNRHLKKCRGMKIAKR